MKFNEIREIISPKRGTDRTAKLARIKIQIAKIFNEIIVEFHN